MKPANFARRRVNGFAVFEGGRLLTESIHRFKFGTIEWAKTTRTAEHPERVGWTWAQHAEADGLTLRRVQVVVLEEVQARHGNTGKQRKGRA